MNEDGQSRAPDVPIARLAIDNPRETRFMRHFAASSPSAGRGWTPLERIAPRLAAGVVKAEDPRFFEHHGVDWRATARVGWVAVRRRTIVAGGSTISQQLARNLYLTPARLISRKLREAALAIHIERVASKARILELYLNLIQWGRDIWGCTEAAGRYFGKRPDQLDLFESTFLVSLVPAPAAPFSGRNAVRARRAQLSLAYQIFLSGLDGPDACAACSHRIWRLHRLVADGMPLPGALSASADVSADADATLLAEVAAALGWTLIGSDDLLASHYGRRQQRITFDRLRARFGDDVLLRVVRAESYAALRARMTDEPSRVSAIDSRRES